MEVIKIVNFYPEYIELTEHFLERKRRMKWLKENGIGNPVLKVLVDKKHENGKEIHCITDKGIILIFNYRSEKFITALIARKQQVKRYYNALNLKPNSAAIKCAERNELYGYNKL